MALMAIGLRQHRMAGWFAAAQLHLVPFGVQLGHLQPQRAVVHRHVLKVLRRRALTASAALAVALYPGEHPHDGGAQIVQLKPHGAWAKDLG